MNKRRILIMGDSNVDLIVKGLQDIPKMGQEAFVDGIELHTGGSAANVAVSLAKLGVNAALHSFQGDDAFAQNIRSFFQEIQLDDQYLRILPGVSTGITIAVSDGSDRFFISDMGSNRLYDPLDFPPEDYTNFQHVHFSLYHIRLLSAYRQAADHARNAGCTISLDLGWTDFDGQRQELLDLLDQVDVFFPNLHEARYLCGDHPPQQLAELLAQHVRGPVVITMGQDGACCLDKGEFYQCSFQAEAKDAVGAGDAFDAGFLKEYLRGAPARQCLLHGSACGAIAVSSTGGCASSPTAQQLEEFLQTQTPQEQGGMHL